jgi:uncharacterized protein (DUF1800 family)
MRSAAFSFLVLGFLLPSPPVQARDLHFPYQEQGLSQSEAAAHLLDRLAYGPTPGQVDSVCKQGLESWVQQQFKAGLPSPALDRALAKASDRSDDNSLRQRKLLRAVYSRNQLQEVLTDFWFNHFNVSLTEGQCRPFVASYENDAIRANAFGPFRNLLEATSHHPAMLYYLGNTFSNKDKVTTTKSTRSGDPLHLGIQKVGQDPSASTMMTSETKSGLNENYGRELMELHTLGVDGGYRQDDVTQVARAFTGWTVVRDGDPKQKDRPGHFFFDSNKHDPEPKRVLFITIQPGGESEGEKVLDILATQSATAHFISKKLAVRFVSDQPSKTLIDAMSRTFLRSRGDVREILSTMLESPEFWSRENLHAKIKTPVELEASAIRILGARLSSSSQLPGLMNRMGEAAYSCPPPTGFPDRADYWVSPGNLMQRMSFAVDLAGNKVAGVTVDLNSLHPVASSRRVDASLPAYASLLLPGRDIVETERLLKSSALDPDYAQKLSKAAHDKTRLPAPAPQASAELNDKSLANLVGLLLGCPEFQRR